MQFIFGTVLINEAVTNLHTSRGDRDVSFLGSFKVRDEIGEKKRGK